MRLSIGTFFAIGALLLAAGAQATTVNITPVTFETARAEEVDGILDEIWPVHSLFVRRDDFAFFRGSFELDLGSIPADMVVTNAILELVTVSGFTDDAFQLYGYSGDGTTTLDDFTNGTLVGSLPRHWQSTSANAFFDVTPFIQSLVATSASHAGFYIKLTYEELGTLPPEPFRGSFQFMQFVFPASGALSVEVSPPVNGVPEPATMLLLLMGTAFLAGAGRRIARP